MNSKTLGEVLRRRRLEQSLTQRDLATRMGFHEGIIAEVERGDQAPTPQYLDRFVETLQLPGREIADLWNLYREEPPNVKTSGDQLQVAACPFPRTS